MNKIYVGIRPLKFFGLNLDDFISVMPLVIGAKYLNTMVFPVLLDVLAGLFVTVRVINIHSFH